MEESYKDNFKFRAISLMIKRSLPLQSEEAILWRRKARRYLRNFPYQWENRNLLSWNIDTEVFEQLQLQAKSLMMDFG